MAIPIHYTITDLTNTKWKINSGWSAPSGYGIFKLLGSVKYSSIEENFNNEGFAIGYEWYADGLDFYFKKKENVVSNSWTGSISNDNELIIDIIEGNDVTNTSLISWLETYGEQIVEETKPTEYTLRIDGVEVTDYENVIVNGVSYKCKKGASVPKTIYVYDINGGATYTFNVGNASTYGDITFPCYDVNGEKYLFLSTNDNSSLNIVLNSSQVNRDVYHIYTGSLSNVVKITDSIENGVTLYCTSSGHSGGTID